MINIIQNRKYYFLISGILIAASVAALFIWGLKFGIDFTGGSLLEVAFQDKIAPVGEVQEKLVSLGVKESVIQPIGEKDLLLRLPVLDEIKHQEVAKELFKSFGAEEKSFESVGPTLGREMRTKAFWSIVIVLLAIISYIAFAFRKVSYPVASWKYGVNAVIALAHDVIIPLGLFAVLGRYLNVEISGALVAAMLTILGFSVHDTIVVFDRTRENLFKYRDTLENIVNRSVNETLARSLTTTFTTILALLAVYFFGGESVRYFSLMLIVGISIGAYSSIFIASPLLVVWHNRSGKK
jgi:preprotein translocase subunit SecF